MFRSLPRPFSNWIEGKHNCWTIFKFFKWLLLNSTLFLTYNILYLLYICFTVLGNAKVASFWRDGVLGFLSPLLLSQACVIMHLGQWIWHEGWLENVDCFLFLLFRSILISKWFWKPNEKNKNSKPFCPSRKSCLHYFERKQFFHS